MEKYTNLLFDLDGTIIDPKEGITNSVKNALNYFEIKVENQDDLCKFIGPPLGDSFSRYYHFDEEETKIAIEKYREYFRVKGIYENTLYDGIEDLLCNLYISNKKLILATSKPEDFAIEILRYYDLCKYFESICGATMDSSRSKKGEVIKYAIEENNLKLEETIMIGDKSHDIIGANENNIDSLGVLYGYGDYNELSESGAAYIVRDVKELRRLLTGK